MSGAFSEISNAEQLSGELRAELTSDGGSAEGSNENEGSDSSAQEAQPLRRRPFEHPRG